MREEKGKAVKDADAGNNRKASGSGKKRGGVSHQAGTPNAGKEVQSREVGEMCRAYTDSGLSIIPLCGPGHGCGKPGKVPFNVERKAHAKRWNSDEFRAEIQNWSGSWDRWSESYNINIGIITGAKSGIIGVDLDGSDSIEYFQELVSCRVDEIPTWAFSTGNGYRVIYGIRDHNHFPSLVIRGEGRQIEILGDGKQTVAPPSTHVSGRTYRWLPSRSPFVLDEPLECPQWILDFVESKTVVTSEEPDPVDWASVVAQGIDSGGRNEGLTKILGRVLNPAPLDIDTFYQIARCLNIGMCRPPLPESEIRSIVKSLFKRETIQQSLGHDEREIRRIMSQYRLTRADAIMMLEAM